MRQETAALHVYGTATLCNFSHGTAAPHTAGKEQLARFVRHVYIPLSGLYVYIFGAASHKGDDSQQHGSSRDGKSDGPAHALLDIHQGGDRQEGPQVDGKVEPVEKAVLLLSILNTKNKVAAAGKVLQDWWVLVEL